MSVLIFDWELGRYLKHLGYEVSYVRNFTDVDDKVRLCCQDSGSYNEISQLNSSWVKSYTKKPLELLQESFSEKPLKLEFCGTVRSIG